MRIFHLALASEWAAAQTSGTYTTSTLGRTLAEEGFIHASRGDQWQGVRERFYHDVTEPLVLLNIDTDRLTAPVVEEAVPGTAETFPHIYGALNVDAVVSVIELDPASSAAPAPEPTSTPDPLPYPTPDPTPTAPSPDGPSFSALFLGELFFRVAIASLVLICCLIGTLIGLATGADWGPIIGAGVGLIAGAVIARIPLRRRAARWARSTSH